MLKIVQVEEMKVKDIPMEIRLQIRITINTIMTTTMKLPSWKEGNIAVWNIKVMILKDTLIIKLSIRYGILVVLSVEKKVPEMI